MCTLVLSRVRCVALEDEKVQLQKEISDARNGLREVEAARVEARRHWQDLRHALKAVEAERNLLTTKLNDLQTNLTQANDKLEQLGKDNFALKQKVVLC